MSHPDRTVVDHSRSLVRAARRLVAQSRQVRHTAAAARRHASTMIERASEAAAGREHLAARSAPTKPNGEGDSMERRQHDRLARPGRRQTDRRPSAADHRRVLLAGSDEGWRLLMAYVFEEAGYVVYAAEDPRQAAAFSVRLLPDVVVAYMEITGALDLVARLARVPSTFDIPVAVLTPTLHSSDADRARAAGAMALLPHEEDAEVLVGEVDSLIAVESRAQRTLKRRLLDLQALAKTYTPDAAGQARLRRLIDHLQVAIFAVNEEGLCVAASHGATKLTGYSHVQLLTAAVFQAVFAGARPAGGGEPGLLENLQYSGSTIIVNHEGQQVPVHAAAMEAIMPGFHVAALAAAAPRGGVHSPVDPGTGGRPPHGPLE